MDVLIVGNGFDRKLGLKTDYISFLDWMKEQGFGVGTGLLHISEAIRCSNELKFPSRVAVLRDLPVKSIQNTFFTGVLYDFKTAQQSEQSITSDENLTANKIIFSLPDILGNSVDRIKSSPPNIWYCFIQILRFEKKEKVLGIEISDFLKFIDDNGNWVDLEGLIQSNIYSRIDGTNFNRTKLAISYKFDVFSLANLLISTPGDYYERNFDEIVDIVWNDFLDFKSTLCEYFQSLHNEKLSFFGFQRYCNIHTQVEEDSKFVIVPAHYSPIINFNYTDYIFDSKNTYTYYVHGKVSDKEEVVFGLDEYIKDSPFITEERVTKFEKGLRKNKKLLRFSKVSQLLKLQIDKESIQFDGLIGTLSIVGHSIGEQDYAYYFSLFEKSHQGIKSIDRIRIVCLWYSYGQNQSNKDEMKEKLFEMLTHYERVSNKKVLHAMIFEGRIKFKEVYIPKLV